MVQGSSVTNSVTATITLGVARVVNFGVSGLPAGATGTFSQTSCSPTCITTLTIVTSASTSVGDYTINLVAISGSVLEPSTYIPRTSSFVLTVIAAPLPSPTPTPTITPTGQPTPTPIITPTPSSILSVGSRVKTTSNLNVRLDQTVLGKLLGTKAKGSYGIITSGPVFSEGYTWWEIDYDIAPDGWSADLGLENVAPESVSPVISRVLSSYISKSYAHITWTTNEASDTQVEYGPTISYGSITSLNPDRVTSHGIGIPDLAPGTTYNYRVKSKDAFGNLTVSSNYTFTTPALSADTTLPKISISAPAANAFVRSRVTVSASASDNIRVGGVRFMLDGAFLGAEDTAAPFTMVWDSRTASNGLHTLTAVVRDSSGNSLTSLPRTVTVDNITPVISSVVSSNTHDKGTTVSWFTDEPANTQVQYGISTSYGSTSPLVSTLLTSHIQKVINMIPNTLYHYRAVSRDKAGNLAISPDITVQIPPDITAPVITRPAAGYITNQYAYFTWATNEPADTQVEYGLTPSYGSVTAFLPDMVISHASGVLNLALGSLYHYRVKSRDPYGNQAVSGDFTFTTKTSSTDITPPTVSISSPAAGALVRGNSVKINASARDNIRVAGVKFMMDDLVLGAEDIVSPFGIIWNSASVPDGTHTISATAYDSSGNATQSASRTITVDNTFPAISGVAVSNLTATGARIFWTTNEPSTSQIQYGLTSSYGLVTSVFSTLVSSHAVSISGLQPKSTYYYHVISKDRAGNVGVSGGFTLTTL